MVADGLLKLNKTEKLEWQIKGDANTTSDIRENIGPLSISFIEGTFFAGRAAAILWWAEEFYRLHRKWTNMGYFTGKDQVRFCH